MRYSRSMIGLTLVLMIGLALPSSVLTQRKIAKGAKKNAPQSLQGEAIPVELVAPLAMTMPELEAAVTEAVLDILEEPPEPDNERRNLDVLLMSVQITETTETECAEQYLKDIRCYAATIMIDSKEDLVDRLLQLTEALNVVIRIENGSIAITQQRRGGYPYVKVKNTTPYPVGPPYYSESTNNYNGGPWYIDNDWKGYLPSARVWYGCCFCSTDDIDEGIAPGDTWSGTSRGICAVTEITAILTLPDGEKLTCAPYKSLSTTYSEFFIIMKGEEEALQAINNNGYACCVQSSHQSGVCA